MDKMKFHHIGIAVEHMHDMLEHLQKHMEILNVSEIVFDEYQNATLCMVTLRDGTRIELVSGEVVKGILKKRQFLYHSCFSVPNIEKKKEEMEREGYFVISDPKEAVLFDNQKVCFLSGELGMIELLEEFNGK